MSYQVMEKKFSIKGTYQVSGSEEKEFEISYDNSEANEEQNEQLFRLLDQPLQLLLNGGQYGVGSLKRFFGVVVLFCITNVLLFFYALIRLFMGGVEGSKMTYLGLLLLLCIGICVYVAYRMYQYVILNVMEMIFNNLKGLFQKLCSLMIDKAEGLWNAKAGTSGAALRQAINFEDLLNNRFVRMPRILRKGLSMVLSKVPLLGMLADLENEILGGGKEAASQRLYEKMNQFVVDTIFANNDTKWVWWMLPLNIVIVIMLIHAKIA